MPGNFDGAHGLGSSGLWETPICQGLDNSMMGHADAAADAKDTCSIDSNDSERLRYLDEETDCLTVLLQRQRENNRALRQQYQDQLHHVRILQEENAAIMRMVAALQPHKFSFTLEPADSLVSLAEGFGVDATSSGRHMSEPDKQSHQTNPLTGANQPTPAMGSQHADGAQPDAAMHSDDDELQASNEAEVEAVAAAALAVNRGNPAAALIDLLNLARKRQLMTNPAPRPIAN